MRKISILTIILMVIFSSCAFAEILSGNLAFEDASYEVSVGKAVKLKVISQHIEGKLHYEWSSSDESIATVKNGKARGVSGGTVTISCTATSESGSVFCAECMLTVNILIQKIRALEVSILLGETPDSSPVALHDFSTIPIDYEAYAERYNVSVEAAWEACRINLCAHGLSNPQAEAILNGERILEPKEPYYRYKPTIIIEPANASNQELEWSTSNWHVAEVSSDGIISSVRPGIAMITGKATDGSNRSVKIKVTVPTYYATTDSVVVTEEQGVIFGYLTSVHGHGGIPEIVVKGNCFRITEVEGEPDGGIPACFDKLKYLRVEPEKAGKGSIQFRNKGRTLTTVKVTIEESAVRSAKTYPLYNQNEAEGDTGAYTGRKVSIQGPFSLVLDREISIDGQSMTVLYGMDKTQNRVYCACDLAATVGFVEGEALVLYGTIDQFYDYMTVSGLEYAIPCLSDVRFVRK